MAASFNQVTIVGTLCRDVELRYLPSGKAVTDITLAINERVKRGEEWVEEPVFVDVTLFHRTAEVASQYLSKGSSALIAGKLRLDQWETKDGEKRSKLKVVCDRLQLLGGNRNEYDQRRPEAENVAQAPANAWDEEAPF